ncbi:MAG: sigma-54-dependent Fis family transcriptional regulator [Zetaproteobacteria bacterium CG06_land_8_20_14_3_00_59_53]|nr:MAG: transcriptional regulator [Zetaproteobacteria bacterium CG2_30_59_37]PIO90763.1 MAG: transcriptional regulator [Zetaproteobacteria bacterium CG23_combo_of_CG06-09_8_20_14_all_59_86]PIQ65335.1 MAG: transcriptional regulator [Zetaproteobacteria bacterium CG11_big_fil_rev_8_21_14_0_20_59_439]PIU69877.1 MAG: sigma-54-dependent Fis family transcriptional regulator [Zetaproteobacteria bacterium CG06_land_8_20_14_3_00_59_53]PIU97403.1 MAG: sigma-54-dependent Fis family transcriptional regulato
MAAACTRLVGFPADNEADLRVQLGRVLPDTRIEADSILPDDVQLDADSLVFMYDSLTTEATVTRLFSICPQAIVVILAATGDQDRAADLMHMGVMDYRFLPCTDEVLSIYARKAGHLAELSKQASSNQKDADTFITENTETRRLLDQVALVAPSNASVLVVGESGTGKERLSRFVHQCSNRRDRAFIAINCAAIPEGILESELFGHEKGAFTGATASRPGKFELAHQGTLLLDEITEMPLHLQAKLLRVLQEGEVDRLGGRAPVSIDVRVIATSNRDIDKAVAEGTFRQDLYYRLNVVTVRLPALRDRTSDIEPLTRHFLEGFSRMYNRPVPHIGEAAMRSMQTHDWPGNVRELENCMHRAFLMCANGEISPEHLALPDAAPSAAPVSSAAASIAAGMSIRDMERALIQETLQHVRGNRTEAARLLGISIRTLRNKLNEFDSGTPLAQESKQQAGARNHSPAGLCNV